MSGARVIWLFPLDSLANQKTKNSFQLIHSYKTEKIVCDSVRAPYSHLPKDCQENPTCARQFSPTLGHGGDVWLVGVETLKTRAERTTIAIQNIYSSLTSKKLLRRMTKRRLGKQGVVDNKRPLWQCDSCGGVSREYEREN
jgi:hypothetical protein